MDRFSPRRRAWLKRLAAVVTAFTVSLPAIADAHPLEELLRMRFEQLLELQITTRRAALAPGAARHADDVLTRYAP